MGEQPQGSLIPKYFLHGILFSILFLGLAFFWALILAALVAIGLFIGLIIGLLVLFLIIGGLNVALTDFVWQIPIKSDWKSLLAHGFVLFMALLVVSVPSIIIRLAIPSIVTTIVLFIVYCFIDGFVAKNIAGYWEEEDEEDF
jgi:hypothetical protein